MVSKQGGGKHQGGGKPHPYISRQIIVFRAVSLSSTACRSGKRSTLAGLGNRYFIWSCLTAQQ